MRARTTARSSERSTQNGTSRAPHTNKQLRPSLCKSVPRRRHPWRLAARNRLGHCKGCKARQPVTGFGRTRIWNDSVDVRYRPVTSQHPRLEKSRVDVAKTRDASMATFASYRKTPGPSSLRPLIVGVARAAGCKYQGNFTERVPSRRLTAVQRSAERNAHNDPPPITGLPWAHAFTSAGTRPSGTEGGGLEHLM